MAEGTEIVGPDGLVQRWEIDFFETDGGRKPVLDWIKHELSPTKRRALGTAMRRVLQVHGPAVARSAWGRPVEKGIFEFRLSHGRQRDHQSRSGDPRDHRG